MRANRTWKTKTRTFVSFFGLSLLLYGCLSLPSQAQSSPQLLDLMSGADVTITGRRAGDALIVAAPGALTSNSTMIAADVNGDGLSDLIIGFPQADGPGGRTDAGQVYIIYGQRGLPSGSIRDLANTPPDIIVYGADSGDELGSSLAAGDINGDRVKDVIVGAPHAAGPNNSRPNVGEVYVLFGGAALRRFPTRDLANTSTGPDITIYGWGGSDGKAGDRAGTAVASGDVNGDGIDDVIVGAPGEKGPDDKSRAGERGFAPDAGAVFIFFGSSTPPAVRDASMPLPAGVNMLLYGRLGKARISALSIDFGESAGGAVAVGDVNGDGLTDVIVGAASSNGPMDDRLGAGAIYVILGRRRNITDPPLAFDVDQRQGSGRRVGSPPDAYIYGARPGDQVGVMLAAGDINGDGKADIIFSNPEASGANNAKPSSGQVQVIFGAQTLTTPRDLTNGADFTILGANQSDRLGFALAVGNVNGDRIMDLIIGAPTASDPSNSRQAAGDVFILVGKTGLTGTLDFSQSSQAPDMTIVGANYANQFGFTVAAGDFNGDSRDDVIASGPFATSIGVQGIKYGLTYVLYSGGFK